MTFIDPKGKFLDDTEQILEEECSESYKFVEKNEVNLQEINKKILFTLCINTLGSHEIIKDSLNSCFIILKYLLQKKECLNFSMSKNYKFTNFGWDEVEELICKVFENSNIKIVVCCNQVSHINSQEEKDRIFDQFHNSCIGSHAGVNKTYWAIREKFFWKNLKQEIQNRINKKMRNLPEK